MAFVEANNGCKVLPVRINGKNLALDESRFITIRSAAQTKEGNELVSETRPPLKVAAIIESRMGAFTEMQVKETSCPKQWAEFNVGLATRVIKEIATSISGECSGELPAPDNPMAFCMVFKDPVGPVLAIEPWNASVILSARALAAPLAAGCTVVFKAFELCPGVHHTLVQAFEDAGIPAGCINVLQAQRQDAPEVTEALISHPAIRKIAFTGSANVGKSLGQLAAKYLKPVLMELGGKAPAIVLKDANIEQAAKLCAHGAFLHHGQICMSTERIIVVKDVADKFVEALKSHVLQHYQDGAGSAVTVSVAQRARSLVEDAVKNGVKCKDSIYGEETFGPSASFYTVENEDEAVRLANDTKYGLNAAVHSRDILAALKVARRIECGQVHINSITEYDEANAPIGGVKGSGWGRNNGKFALREFLIQKTISIHDASASVNFGGH